MSIVHQDNFNKKEYQHYIDEPYFRLIHNLQNLSVQALPQGYSLYKATLKDFAEHINRCYSKIGVTEANLRDYTARPVYDSALWLAVRDNQTNEVVATGIAELDKEIGEGVLEWIQVSEQHRGQGLQTVRKLWKTWRQGSGYGIIKPSEPPRRMQAWGIFKEQIETR